MSEYQDPSANTGRFRAFVERGGEEEAPQKRRSSLSPAVLAIAGVVIVAIVIVIALAA